MRDFQTFYYLAYLDRLADDTDDKAMKDKALVEAIEETFDT
jgi:hypothetical protein